MLKPLKLNNIELFEECFDHPAEIVDPIARETLNNVDNDFSELEATNRRLMSYVKKYKESRKANEKKELVVEIDRCVEIKGMNLSPFCQYFFVHNITHDIYKQLDVKTKEYVIDCFIEDRYDLYSKASNDYVFQILYDSYSHKRKGELGTGIIKKICKDLKIPHIEDINDIDKKSFYILPDKNDKLIFNHIKQVASFKFEFKNTHQDKMPDALIKIGEYYVIVEHKILKQSGGGQDKQITEIIDFIKNTERGVLYVSFMDGILFNELESPSKKNKLYTDRQNITQYLKDNEWNYFVNRYGFIKLIKQIIKESSSKKK